MHVLYYLYYLTKEQLNKSFFILKIFSLPNQNLGRYFLSKIRSNLDKLTYYSHLSTQLKVYNQREDVNFLLDLPK